MTNNFIKTNTILFALLKAILVYAFIIFNPWTTFPYTFVVIIISVFTLVYGEDKSFSRIGFNPSASLPKTIGISFALFVLLIPILDFVIQPLVNLLTGEAVDFSAFQPLANNFKLYAKYMVFVLISAAFGEEILFRGFLFRQLRIIVPEFKFKTHSIVFISAILFSIPHLYQGLSGLLMTFLFGIIFATIYVKSNYNLWVTIILHGLIDSMFLTLAYYDKLDYYKLGNDLIFGF